MEAEATLLKTLLVLFGERHKYSHVPCSKHLLCFAQAENFRCLCTGEQGLGEPLAEGMF